MKFILGKKEEMTQFFDAEGRAFAATVVSAGPMVVTQTKSKEKDGYSALQYGYGTKRESLISKPLKGHMKGGNYRVLRELSGEGLSGNVGDKVDVSVFSKGDTVDISGVSKGKGFQGVVKRHGFHGGPRTHGQKHSEREPGSIGGGLRTRVPKGMRMGGRMGSDRVTVKNLTILDIDPENNFILIKGALPGRRGTLLEIKESIKSAKKKNETK